VTLSPLSARSGWTGGVMTARLYGPSKVIAIDLDDSRLKRASDFGATDTVNSGDADWKEQVLASLTAKALTLRSRRLVSRRRSPWQRSSFAPAEVSPTSACTASRSS